MVTEEFNIIVDGCEYIVEHTQHAPFTGKDHIEVWTKTLGLVADAKVDHNTECVSVCFNTMPEDTNTSYPYFDYTSAKSLAEWMVACWPE